MADTYASRLEDAENAAHSFFAPSASVGWMNCPGFLWANAPLPDTAGFEAAEGTVFHTVMETPVEHRARLFGVKLKAEAGGDTYEIEVTSEMLSFADDCDQWVKDLPKPWFTERKVWFSDLTPTPHQGGTCDFAAIEVEHDFIWNEEQASLGDANARGPRTTLHIRDWKYGTGVAVYAADNIQVLLYAYGFFREFDDLFRFDRVVVGIGQPRHERFETAEYSRQQLLDFAAKVKEAAHRAWPQDAPRIPGPHCLKSFCKASATCPARLAMWEEAADDIFGTIETEGYTPAHQEHAIERLEQDQFRWDKPRATTLQTKHLTKILRHRRQVERFLADVEEELIRRSLDGEQIDEMKLVEGRSKRVWRDPRAAFYALIGRGLLDDAIIRRILVSPNQALDLLKRLPHPEKPGKPMGKAYAEKLLAALLHKPPGRPTLVFDDDSREALSSDTDGIFDVLPDETDGL